MVTIVYPW